MEIDFRHMGELICRKAFFKAGRKTTGDTDVLKLFIGADFKMRKNGEIWRANEIFCHLGLFLKTISVFLSDSL